MATPIHRPMIPRSVKNARQALADSPNTMYPTKLQIAPIFCFPHPLRIPPETAANPSKIWYPAAIGKIEDASLILWQIVHKKRKTNKKNQQEKKKKERKREKKKRKKKKKERKITKHQ
jgi:hypothetical protein